MFWTVRKSSKVFLVYSGGNAMKNSVPFTANQSHSWILNQCLWNGRSQKSRRLMYTSKRSMTVAEGTLSATSSTPRCYVPVLSTLQHHLGSRDHERIHAADSILQPFLMVNVSLRHDVVLIWARSFFMLHDETHGHPMLSAGFCLKSKCMWLM